MICNRTETLAELVLSGDLAELRVVEDHAVSCADCTAELAELRATVDSFHAWPTDVLSPSTSLRRRLAERISSETGIEPVADEPQTWTEAEWSEVAPGISCKLLATDVERNLVSMLVRLAPNTAYPPHTHAGVEELHLLNGELWIDDRMLCPGEYNRAGPGTSDAWIWSGTGCTCVLVTSARDILR